MKNRIIILALAALIPFGCDDFLDINKNPNQTTVSTPELVLTSAMNTTISQNFPNQMAAMWVQHWSPSGDVSGFVQEKTYDFNNTYGTGIWTNYYDNLTDYKYVMDEGAKTGRLGAAAIAKIMSTYCYHKLVDTYNNVPYTDALQGTKVIRPSYDPGQSVYEAIIDDLDEAVAELKAITDPADNPGAADIAFGGNYTKWVQFANTLKLRLLIRQSEMPGRSTYITSEIGQMTTFAPGDAMFITTDATSTPGYLKTAGKQNPFWDTYLYSETNGLRNTYNFIRSTRFLSNTIGTVDNRRYYIMGPSGTQPWNTSLVPAAIPFTINPVTYGDETPAAYSNASSGMGRGLLKAYDQPQVLITLAESNFLQAEAVMKNYLTGSAQAFYEAGVRASFALLGVANAATEATNYLGTTQGAYNGTLTQLITQKYIASVGFASFEAWADFRRLGIPAVPLSSKAIRNGIPTRLYYPNQELQTNAENVTAQGDIDAITSKVFWDVN